MKSNRWAWLVTRAQPFEMIGQFVEFIEAGLPAVFRGKARLPELLESQKTNECLLITSWITEQ